MRFVEEGDRAGPADGSEESTLPAYGVRDWRDDGTGYIFFQGLSPLAGDGPGTTLSVGSQGADGDRRVDVTSHRRGHTPIEDLRTDAIDRARSFAIDQQPPPEGRHAETAGPEATGLATIAWDPVSILVADIPTLFSVTVVEDSWAAVSEGPQTVITIAAHKVPLPDVSLIRLPDPPTRHLRPPRNRPPRPRRFPEGVLGSPLEDTGPANLDLSHAGQRLAGTYAGADVDLHLDVPHSHSRASGVFAGLEVSASWQLGSNYYKHPDVRSTLHGRVADQTLTLTGGFHLDEDYGIERTVITGHIGSAVIEATVEALDGGLCDGRTVAVDGHFGDTIFALAATISADLRHGTVVGTVDDTPVRVDTTRRPGPATQITGSYHGPPALLALIVGTLLFFA